MNNMESPDDPLEIHEAGPHVPGWGGARKGAGRPPGIPNPGTGRKPDNPAGAKVKVNIRLDPDVHRQVAAYATANKITFNAAINAMLSAI